VTYGTEIDTKFGNVSVGKCIEFTYRFVILQDNLLFVAVEKTCRDMWLLPVVSTRYYG